MYVADPHYLHDCKTAGESSQNTFIAYVTAVTKTNKCHIEMMLFGYKFVTSGGLCGNIAAKSIA